MKHFTVTKTLTLFLLDLVAAKSYNGSYTNTTSLFSSSPASSWSSQVSLSKLTSPSPVQSFTTSRSSSAGTNATGSGNADSDNASVVFQTMTFTVPPSGQTVVVGGGGNMRTLTLTGPATFVTTETYSRRLPEPTSSLPARCFSTAETSNPDRLVTYVTQVVVPSGKTLSEVKLVPWYGTGSFSTQKLGLSEVVTKVLTGPITAIETHTTQIIGKELGQGWLQQLGPDECRGRCGFCSIYFASVDVYFWPAATTNTACLTGSTAITSGAPVTSQASLPPAKLGARTVSLVGNGTGLAVKDGFTFTSPSVYLVFPAISAADHCGLRGQARTSVTLAVEEGSLSTFRGIGNAYSYNFADVLCPPVADPLAFSYLGQGYRPIISPPPAMRSLDPAWANCALGAFQGNDPPKVMNPAAAMDPMTTIADPILEHAPATPSSAPTSLPPVTASTRKAADPTTSAEPSKGDPSQNIDPNQNVDPHHGSAPAPTSIFASNPKPTPAADPSSASPSLPPVTVSTRKAADPTTSAEPGKGDPSQNVDPNQGVDAHHGSALSLTSIFTPDLKPTPAAPSTDPSSLNNNNVPPASKSGDPILDNQPGHGSNPPSWTSITVAPSAGSNPSAGSSVIVLGSINVALPSPPASHLATVAGQIISAAPSGVAIGGSMLTPGGPAMTISGTPISLGSSVLAIGSSFVALPSSSIVTMAGMTFTADPTGFAMAGTTLTPGGAPATLAGTVISLGSSSLFIGTQAIQLPQTPSSSGFIGAGDQMVTADANGVTFNGMTLYQGGPAVTISGTLASLGPSGLVIGSSTIPVPLSASVFVAGGQTFTANPTGFPIAGTSILKGGPAITISGIPVSLSPSGLVIGANVYQLPDVFTVGGQTFTPNPTGFAIAGTSLLRGGPAITISGTPVSLTPSGLVIGTNIYQVPDVFTVGGQTFTPNPTGFSIAGTSISKGGPGITISGTPISLSPSGLVIGTDVYQPPDVFTVGGQVFTANPTGFAIGGTTLSPGGSGITVAGTPISLGPSNSLYIGPSAISLATATATSGQGLGPAILSGLGPVGPSSTLSTTGSNTTVQAFVGSQAKLSVPRTALASLILIVLGTLAAL